MSDPGCGLPREWLIGMRDGDLHAAQLELAETHLRACPHCRRWMAQMDEIDRLLRDATPYRDNPIARAQVKARVAVVPERSRLFGSSARGGTQLRLLTGGLAVLAVLLLAAVPGRGPITAAGSGLADWIREEPVRLPPASQPGTPVVAPAGVSGAIELPLGLAQAGDTATGDTFIQRYYRSDSGLAISYSADCSGTNYLTEPRDPGLSETVGVNGVPVRVDYGLKRGSVIALYWARGDTLHEILILEDTTPPLSLKSAQLLVTALLDRDEAHAAVACTDRDR